MSVTLTSVITHHIERKIANGEWTKGTAQNTRSTLKCFAERVREIHKSDPEIREVDTVLVNAAIKKQWPDTGKTTYASQYARIKAFFNWALKRGYEFGDIEVFMAKSPAIPQVEKKFATREEVVKATTLLRARGNNRDAGFMEFFFESSRRPGEVCKIQVKDLDFRPTPTRPYGVYWFSEDKSGQGRQEVILTETMREILERWLKEYREEMGGDLEGDWFLFPARVPLGRGTKLVPERGIVAHSDLVRDIWKEAGVYELGKSGHAVRRGGMTERYDELEAAGHRDPIVAVMGQSRHKSRKVAEGYINRVSSQMASDRAIMELDANRRAKRSQTIQDLQAERVGNVSALASTPEPEEVSQPEVSNVISFASLRQRRTAG